MRKKLLSISLIVLLIAVAGLCFASCKKPQQTLPAPAKVSVNSKGVVSWQSVDGAESYELRINNAIVPCSATEVDLLQMYDTSVDREFTVRVRAVSGDERSDWSQLVTYTLMSRALSRPMLKIKDGKISWLYNAQASKVVVTVDGVKTDYPATTSQYDVSALQQNSIISVQLIGDGLFSYDSEISSVIYNAATGNLGLVAPQNVRMDGYELTFDPVYGAREYYLLDVNNNITTITTTHSDRTNKNLIKSVWAVDTRGEFEDSAHTDVTYYAEGAGTQQDPFLISTPAELRFVEFYESTGQSKYYKFKNDIALPSYTPGEEEEYNNFYNLGSLSGVIDGGGYKLSNSVVYFRDGYSSLFDSITPDGVIKNLVIDNANFRTWTNMTNDGIMHEKGGECAILTYTNRGTLDNITVIDSYVYAVKDGAAALVSVNKGTITNSCIESSTRIYGANEAGGFAIFNSGTISNCINRADIAGETTVGGIVGRNNGTVSQCGNEGSISAITFAGGIVGYNYNLFDEELLFDSTISQCYNYGDINVTSYGGGIVGKNGGDGLNEVGKLSYANAGIISCYNTGSICGANSLGGIVGDNYAYHEDTTDLGVVNCYNTGEITVNTNKLRSTRVFLSLEKCSWATQAGALFYMHYWGAAGESAWPGVRMTQVRINSRIYYYADMSLNAEQLTGVIFNRINPDNGEIWSQTDDIKCTMTSGNLLFKVDNTWKTATIASSMNLVSSTPITAGGIAGYNNMINDCYYLEADIDGNPLAAGIAQGSQENKILIGETAVESSACQIEASELSTFASTLNTYADVWDDSANGPVLKWQRRG